ncbi:MAG: hypothetical protein F2667_09145 [Actinobacteria bacterium]|uniref:Unannotated protein n=1 Tax=freshwater metagenome TaxID=449393 RepID=A0A6J6R155_9ZZZZ|nr:hypothetical protein [Actinomycetota bacterium]
MIPRFARAPYEVVARRRPVDVVSPTSVLLDLDAPGPASWRPTPHPAPYAAVEAEPTPGGPVSVLLGSGGVRLRGELDDASGAAWLVVDVGSGPQTFRSRRSAAIAADDPVQAIALSLTGTHACVLTRGRTGWTARAKADLSRLGADTRDETWLAGLHSGHTGAVTRLRAGGFGQLGLRDIRAVTRADGSAYRPDGPTGPVLLSATSAGPGFFDTAHTSVWRLDPRTLELGHAADLFFRRPDRPGAYGDHATHLVRDDDRWLVATSTWGDFDRRRARARVDVTLAESSTDLLTGRHLLDTRPLALPATQSVGVWDPHLVRTAEGWIVGYVSARKFFDFHPEVATGASLEALTVHAALGDRRSSEGTTVLIEDGRAWVLASDGRDNRRRHRERYPVLSLDLDEVTTLPAPYPSNIPWPTLVDLGPDGWLHVAFDGSRHGGRVVGYGSHGQVVLARAAR